MNCMQICFLIALFPSLLEVSELQAQVVSPVRPFAARHNAIWDNLLNAFDPSKGANFQGIGMGTHVGKFKTLGDFFATLDPKTGIATGGGSVVWVTANGDLLRLKFKGTLNTATGAGFGVVQILPGTGRFSAASGMAKFTALIDLSRGPVGAPMQVNIYDGFIRY